MKQFKLLTMLFAALFGLMSTTANAVLLDSGDFITDDVTGLEWLDLSATDGMNYNDAVAAFAADGWVAASQSQYLDMFDRYFPAAADAGVEFISVSDSATTSYVNSISLMLGVTGSSTSVNYTYGILMGDDGSMHVGGLQVWTDLSNINLHRYRTSGFITTADDSFDNFGVYMVRASAVPEASAILLLGLGLIGLGFARHRKA